MTLLVFSSWFLVVFPKKDFGGDAHCRRSVWDIAKNNGVGADPGIVSDMDGSKDLRAGADAHVVPDDGYVIQ